MIENYITPLYVSVESDCSSSPPFYSCVGVFGPFYSKSIALNFCKRVRRHWIVEHVMFHDGHDVCVEDPTNFYDWCKSTETELRRDECHQCNDVD